MTMLPIPQTRCAAGVARVDITPPVGIYHRMWGAATHDQSTGIHRPLTATVLALQPLQPPSDQAPAPPSDGGAAGLIVLAVDHCLLWHDEMESLLDGVAAQSGAPRDQLVVWFSHTHAAGLMGLERRELPGGDQIPAYLSDLERALADAVRSAIAATAPARIVYGLGRCSLATHRDFWDASRSEHVCGFNPAGVADDRVLVARVSRESDERTIATLVNYACHPTTLAWDNTLISPDYVGAMREVVEGATGGAPCLFVQGASGDIGPRDGYVGDTDVADRNGRQLGYAALSALEELPTAGTHFQYSGAVLSGATIGTWKWAPWTAEQQRQAETWRASTGQVALSYRDDLPDREQLLAEQREWSAAERQAVERGDRAAAADARAMVERATRRLVRVANLVPGPAFPYPLQIWRLGQAVWVALNGEHYNLLQRTLRDRFPDTPLIIGALANGSEVWYLPDRESYGKGLYQETASILARGSLERLCDALVEQIQAVLSDSPDSPIHPLHSK